MLGTDRLTNGLKIEGIETVKWEFCIKRLVIVVISSSHYVPEDRARLIGPYYLLCEKLRCTGNFLVEEHCATLEFDNV